MSSSYSLEILIRVEEIVQRRTDIGHGDILAFAQVGRAIAILGDFSGRRRRSERRRCVDPHIPGERCGFDGRKAEYVGWQSGADPWRALTVAKTGRENNGGSACVGHGSPQGRHPRAG